MYWVATVIVTAGAAIAFGWPLIRSRESSAVRSVALCLSVLLIPLSALFIDGYLKDQKELAGSSTSQIGLPAGLESIAWPGSAPRMPASPPITWRVGSESPASVDTLIGGLEARLEREPEDAKGWALLAQSYAFVGEEGHVERAVAKAISLGFDEADLRHRVTLAASR